MDSAKPLDFLLYAIDAHHDAFETAMGMMDDEVEDVDMAREALANYQGLLMALRCGAMLGSFAESGKVSLGGKLDKEKAAQFFSRQVNNMVLALLTLVGRHKACPSFDRYMDMAEREIEKVGVQADEMRAFAREMMSSMHGSRDEAGREDGKGADDEDADDGFVGKLKARKKDGAGK